MSLDGLQVDRVPREEWTQIFDEVWRRYRDCFYARTCTATTGRRCATSTSRSSRTSAHRSDLNYVISEMISELTVQHAYIDGRRLADPAAPAGRASRRASSRSTRRPAGTGSRGSSEGQNEEDIYRSPLTEIGVDVKVGEYVLAIDGEDLTRQGRSVPPAAQQGGPPGDLMLAATASGAGTRIVSRTARSPDEGDLHLSRHGCSANQKRVIEI